MKSNNEGGFSLVELLVVVVVIGIIASLAIPGLRKGIRAAENGAIFATLRTIGSTQVSFYSQNNRFGRLVELNNISGRGLGVPAGSQLLRNRFVLEMVPAAPTDDELRDGYTITATSDAVDMNVYKYEITQTGEIRQILP
ncbi:MAG: prepilin-type N-terminal cleavage/methylation domain-containing protein [Pyrinomonadaceae bacterium]